MTVIRKSAMSILVGVAALVFGAGSASADIETFWKTDVCPDFGGAKPPIGKEVGVMEAPAELLFGTFAGIGGPFCVLFSTPRTTVPFPAKQFDTGNANMIALPGDLVDIGAPGDNWACVVCQYETKTIAVPALTLLGTAVLMGGLFTAALYEMRMRQATR